LIENSKKEVLTGLVERMTFHSLERGFCVLRLKVCGHRAPPLSGMLSAALFISNFQVGGIGR
jgi:hypothetical protein